MGKEGYMVNICSMLDCCTETKSSMQNVRNILMCPMNRRTLHITYMHDNKFIDSTNTDEWEGEGQISFSPRVCAEGVVESTPQHQSWEEDLQEI